MAMHADINTKHIEHETHRAACEETRINGRMVVVTGLELRDDKLPEHHIRMAGKLAWNSVYDIPHFAQAGQIREDRAFYLERWNPNARVPAQYSAAGKLLVHGRMGDWFTCHDHGRRLTLAQAHGIVLHDSAHGGVLSRVVVRNAAGAYVAVASTPHAASLVEPRKPRKKRAKPVFVESTTSPLMARMNLAMASRAPAPGKVKKRKVLRRKVEGGM